MDLQRMGRELRSKRRAQHFRSIDLAQRLGVSQTYVWMVEMAKPRSNGLPSRPSFDLLRRWTHEIGLDAEETENVIYLAGYGEREMKAANAALPVSDALYESDDDSSPPSTSSRTRRNDSTLATRERTERDVIEQVLADRLRRLVRTAERRDRMDEARTLLESYLRWLQTYIDRER